ncbi:MAG: efflux RND transporter permease subunit [Candidatus Riflebacteria bacterium]|nr:efflux RND transporter permease subunit [Candidatus Riflebacteria bacterium]
MILAEGSIRRPVTTIMAFAAIALFGIICYRELGVDLFPEIEFPTVTITCIYRGASPETMETKVVEKIEEQIAALNGIDQVRSVCAENVAQVFAVFTLGRNIDVATQDVRDKISAIRASLPESMDNPIVEKLNTGAIPVLTITVAGDLPPVDLGKYVKDVVKARVQSIPGVGSIREIGLREREIKIWIDNDKLNAHHLTVSEAVGAIRSKNIEVPAGKIEDEHQEFVLKTMGELASVDEFRQLTIAVIGGTPVALGEIATVEDSIQDERVAGKLNGKPTIGLQIRKQSGANAVKVATQVKAAIPELLSKAPHGVNIQVPIDNSPFIEESIHAVLVDMIIGSVLATLVILIFLRNIRSTLISALAIPTSILGAFVLMRWLNITLNMLSTMALSLAVGLLIDDAIVVIENIFRHLQLGKSSAQAASDATEEIGLAVTATTFSLVSVFLPVAFMGGIVGRFFFHFGITLTVSVLVSLVVSFSLTPMLAARYLSRHEQENAVAMFLGKGLDALDSGYRWLLRIALRFQVTVLVIGLVIVAFSAVSGSRLAFGFKPTEDKNLFLVNFRSPAGTSIEGTKKLLSMVENEITSTIGSDVKNIFSTVAGDPLEDPTKGQVYVNLIRKVERLDRPQKTLMEKVRKALRQVPGIERCTIEELDEIAASSGQANSQISYSLLGNDLEVLKRSAGSLKKWMGKAGGFVDIIDSFEVGKPELRLQLDRERMEALGVNVGLLANTMNLLVGGDQAITRFKSEGKQYDVKLRLRRDFREKPESIDNILVRSIDGQSMVPVSNVANVVKDTGPSRINRLRRLREISLGANLEGKSQGTAMKEVQAEAERILPPGFFGEFQGISKTSAESLDNMVFAAVLALTLVYMLLASQFENFIHPLTIMVSVPLASVGAVFALFITKSEVNILTMIGFLMLMGLVVKNGILLVEFINQQRARGLSREEAIMTAGPIRLRPILMTSACMIGGMIPPAISNSPGSELRGSMAVAIIGGLISSTFLTLILLPVVYVWIEKMLGWFGITLFETKQG